MEQLEKKLKNCKEWNGAAKAMKQGRNFYGISSCDACSKS